MRKKIVIDTNVYIDIFNAGLHDHLRDPFRHVVFLAYPVLHELWMGAKGKEESRHLRAFQDRFVGLKRLIIPTSAALISMGRVCHQLRRTGGLDPAHPSHYNDIAIAMSARQIGASVITKNIKDFQVIQGVADFSFHKP